LITRLLDFSSRIHGVEHCLRFQVPIEEFPGPLVVLFCLDSIFPRKIGVGLGRTPIRLRTLDCGEIRFPIKLDQQRALLDPLTFLHLEASDPGTDVGRDIDLNHRLDLAGSVNGLNDLTAACLFHLDRDSLDAAISRRYCQASSYQDDNDRQSDEQLFLHFPHPIRAFVRPEMI